jgi:hypothetical protein
LERALNSRPREPASSGSYPDSILGEASRKELDERANREFARALQSGLAYFGRGQVVESLLYILELEHSIDMNSLVDNVDALRTALSKMFGGASYVVEARISESLGRQLGVDPTGKSLESLVAILKSKRKNNNEDDFSPTEEGSSSP